MRTGAVAGGGGQFRTFLSQAAAHDVKEAGEGMCTTPERCRETWMQERAVRDAGLDEIVEPSIEQVLRIVDHNEVHADEHLKHALIEVEVDRPQSLRVGAGPVEYRFVPVAPDSQLHFEGAVSQAVVINIVLE